MNICCVLARMRSPAVYSVLQLSPTTVSLKSNNSTAIDVLICPDSTAAEDGSQHATTGLSQQAGFHPTDHPLTFENNSSPLTYSHPTDVPLPFEGQTCSVQAKKCRPYPPHPFDCMTPPSKHSGGDDGSMTDDSMDMYPSSQCARSSCRDGQRACSPGHSTTAYSSATDSQQPSISVSNRSYTASLTGMGNPPSSPVRWLQLALLYVFSF